MFLFGVEIQGINDCIIIVEGVMKLNWYMHIMIRKREMFMAP